MVRAFNPPPGWPSPDEGWTPPPGWKPDPSWPEPPQGWQFWVDKAEETGSALFHSTAASASSLFGTTEESTEGYGVIGDPEPGYEGGTAYGPPGSPTHASSVSTTEEGSVDPTAYGGATGTPTGPTGPGGYGGSGGSPTRPAGDYAQDYGPDANKPAGGGARASRASTMGSGAQAGPTAPPPAPSAPADARPNRGTSGILLGLVILGVSAGVTLYGYFNPDADGTFTIWWAPMVVGLLVMVQGVAQWVRARKADGQRRVRAGYTPRKQVTPPGGSSETKGRGRSGGFETGHSSTVPIQNPTDPSLYRRK